MVKTITTINLMTLDKKFIPLDKSWIIRMGILDVTRGQNQILEFLASQVNLGDDLLALQRAAKVWRTNDPIDVGESGTLFRLLQFASWKLGLNKQFIKHGTLPTRKITDNPEIINWPQEKLLELDNNTSQWASAAVLLGDKQRMKNPPYKLQLTYDAIAHWEEKKSQGKAWEPKYDQTIFNQAQSFLELLQGKKPKFIPEQAEDYCFARVFEYITKEQGEKLWPSLKGHESNRIEEMENVILAAHQGQPISSADHRAVEAIALWGILNHKQVIIIKPEAVNKSWPQFWEFLETVK